MKRLLLVLISTLAFGCSDTSTGPTGSNGARVPKPGSQFTFQITEVDTSYQITMTVVSTGLEIRGKKNVMRLNIDDEGAWFFAFEDNGDFSRLDYVEDSTWTTYPIKSKKQQVYTETYESGDYRYEFSNTITYNKENDLTIAGKTLNGDEVEELSVVKSYYQGFLEDTRSRRNLMTFSNEIGMILHFYDTDGNGDMSLVSYTLK